MEILYIFGGLALLGGLYFIVYAIRVDHEDSSPIKKQWAGPSWFDDFFDTFDDYD
jgi:hypothetical protein